MTTRYNAKPQLRYGVAGVPTGYEGVSDHDINIPPCGITDMDRALFTLFDKELNLTVKSKNGILKVPVVFAGSEKWVQMKKKGGLRDQGGSLILPILTIERTDIVQSIDKDIAGRGRNQATGKMTLKRRLSPSDRGLQSLLNRELLRNQVNLAVNPNDASVPNQLLTNRDIGDLNADPTISDGAGLVGNTRQNIFEIITIPTPQFITIKYEVQLWTQYKEQVNQMIEGILSSYLPQIRGWRIDTDKGYWFVAYVTSDDFKSESNDDDTTGKERVVKHTLSIEVPGFVLASDAPGGAVPVRVHVSNPKVSFGISVGTPADSFGPDIVEEPFLGSDDPTLPLGSTKRPDGRQTNHGRVFPDKSSIEETDPATRSFRRGQDPSKWRKVTVMNASGQTGTKLIRVKSQNRVTGELVLDAAQLEGLTIVSIDD